MRYKPSPEPDKKMVTLPVEDLLKWDKKSKDLMN